MTFTPPTSYMNSSQLKTIYEAIRRTHFTAAGSTFTLHHVTNSLPVTPDPLQPFDIPPVDSIVTNDIAIRAMVGVKQDDAKRGKQGEIIECDLKLYAWQEEMEGNELDTSIDGLNLLTKDTLTFEGQIYSILRCEPVMPFFGAHRTSGVNPTPVWNRNFLSARFSCNRLDRARED